MRFVIPSFIVGLSVSLVFAATAANQEPQPNKQQRPRTVGQGNSQSNSKGNSNSSQPSTNTPVEEVDEGDIVRVETQLVSVPAVVTDKNGRPLAGLKLENFAVLEDGKAQTLTNFATTETPFEIALLLDTSGSTREDLGLIRDAANAFIAALRPGDRVAIVAFKNRQDDGIPMATVDLRSGLTDDRGDLRVAIESLGTSNGTPFYDSLAEISKQIFREAPRNEVRGRRAVVALTDGVDSSSNIGFEDARATLARTGVAAYFIQLSTEDTSKIVY